jgi:hypothetical protein
VSERKALVFLITDQSVIKVHDRDPVNAIGFRKPSPFLPLHKIMASLRVVVPSAMEALPSNALFNDINVKTKVNELRTPSAPASENAV